MALPLSVPVYIEHTSGIDVVEFWRAAVERGLGEFREFDWPTDVRELASEECLRIRVAEQPGTLSAVFDHHDAGLVRLHLSGGGISGTIAGRAREDVEALAARLLEQYPRSVAEEDQVPVTFWSYTPNGARAISRRIAVPSWEQVADNYAGDARDHLERMMLKFKPSHGGQLALWQGLPGTGKTWALRALASEWRGWADFHYITDPDVFFGTAANYMLDVILGASDELVVSSEDGELSEKDKWRVLLMEDTGEILAADARQKVGQALARLLNVVDGLIGQGLRILVLVTTNEELKKLHPAVARPGRCAARIEFGELSATEAQGWAEARGVEWPHERATLAELFAAAEGYEAGTHETIGFAP